MQQVRTGGGLTTETENYRFDALGRMDAVTLPNGTLRHYVFDRDSNRTQVTENGTTTATYTYDPQNPNSPGVDQLTSATESGQNRTFVYRPDGEMTARGSDTLTWDGWGRLTGGTFGTTTVSYSFDPLGFRRQRVAGGTTTRYLRGGLFEPTARGRLRSPTSTGPTLISHTSWGRRRAAAPSLTSTTTAMATSPRRRPI